MIVTFIFYCFFSFCAAGVKRTPSAVTPNETETSRPFNATPPRVMTTIVQTSAKLPAVLSTDPPALTFADHSLFRVNHLLLVFGGLILACTILLLSTLLLACRVCQLSRRLKMLSGHSDLMIPAKYGKANNKSDGDAKEIAVLMGDLNGTRDEAGDGGDGTDEESKREGGEEEEREGEKEEEEVAENGVGQRETGAKCEEVKGTPAAAAEDPPSAKEESEKSRDDKTEISSVSGEKEEQF